MNAGENLSDKTTPLPSVDRGDLAAASYRWVALSPHMGVGTAASTDDEAAYKPPPSGSNR
jgi:hypothetical protein